MSPFLKGLRALVLRIFRKINKGGDHSLTELVTKWNYQKIALLMFIVISLTISLVLNNFSNLKSSFLMADEALIVEEGISESQTCDQTSLNDVNLDCNDYYSKITDDGKSEDFLNLYIIEDKTFLAHQVDFNGVNVSVIPSNQLMTYVVLKGDTLEKIAKKFGINVETLKTANSLSKNIITEGKELVILPVSGIYYTIKKGDTLNGIALKYKISENVIREYNNIGSTIVIGKKIILPGAKNIAATTPSQTGAKVNTIQTSSGYFSYPTLGWNWGSAHGNNNGAVDIANACGTPIYASADGIVILAKASGYNGGYGSYIKIQHSNGTTTLYAHLSSLSVGEGSFANQGQVIGKMGTTGKSTGCHLHFEVTGAKNPFVKK